MSDGRKCFLWVESVPGDDGHCCCYLTDLVTIYTENLTTELFKQRFNKLNSDLEVEDFDEILSDVIKTIENGKDVEAKIVDDSRVDINIRWSEDDTEFKFMFSVDKGSPQLFHDHVFTPVAQCLIRVSEEKQVLLETVKKKELEIQDYECSGAKLTRKRLKTGKFKADEAFENCPKGADESQRKKFFSSTMFSSVLQVTKSPSLESSAETKDEGVNDDDDDTNKLSDIIQNTPTVNSSQFEKPNFQRVICPSQSKRMKLSKF